MGTQREGGRRNLTGQDASPDEAVEEGGAWTDRSAPSPEQELLDLEEAEAANATPSRSGSQPGSTTAELPVVDQMMTRSPVHVAPDDKLDRAAGEMARAGIRHLPVVDEDGHLVGILSDRDLRQTLGTDTYEWFRAAVDSLSETVDNVMSHNPIALLSGTGLEAALEIFADEGVGAIPIVDEDEHVIGMLSYVDVLAWLQRQVAQRGTAEEVHASP